MPAQKVRVCLTGSGAKPIAESLGVPFAQEVAANAIALQKKYEKVGTAIELGGQDAKMIFFKESETDHMRKCFRYANERKLCRWYRSIYR